MGKYSNNKRKPTREGKKIKVGEVGALPEGRGATVQLKDGSEVALFNVGGEFRAIENFCPHKGFPLADSRVYGNVVECDLHGWRFDLEGDVAYVHNAPEFFDLDPAELALPRIHCEVWAGFVFINLLDEPRETLREFLTPTVERLEDFPFERMTEAWVCEGVVKANWKVFIDAYQELYHVPYVHSKMNDPKAQATGSDKVPFMVPRFLRFGRHRMYSSGGPTANSEVRSSRPLDALFRSSLYGPIDPPDVGPLGEGINPGRLERWGLDNWMLYPNFTIQVWGLGWYTVYEHWPIDVDSHRFILSMYFVPPRNGFERLSQEHTVNTVREFVLQDYGSCQTLQQAVSRNPRDRYFLNDQEVLVRHLHHCVVEDVERYRRERAQEGGAGDAR